jgi:hypothetical protein
MKALLVISGRNLSVEVSEVELQSFDLDSVTDYVDNPQDMALVTVKNVGNRMGDRPMIEIKFNIATWTFIDMDWQPGAEELLVNTPDTHNVSLKNGVAVPDESVRSLFLPDETDDEPVVGRTLPIPEMPIGIYFNVNQQQALCEYVSRSHSKWGIGSVAWRMHEVAVEASHITVEHTDIDGHSIKRYIHTPATITWDDLNFTADQLIQEASNNRRTRIVGFYHLVLVTDVS